MSPVVSLDPRNLPDYAIRSTSRMVIALACSTGFSLMYGSLAAHNRRAEQLLIPLLAILQSVPVLGFLSITVTGFIALFRKACWVWRQRRSSRSSPARFGT